MSPRSCTLLSFSPTGSTTRVLRAVAEGLARPVRERDLTLPPARQKATAFTEDEAVLLGFPVYGGRLPRCADEIFAAISGSNTPTALVAVYGNRDYEDALLEMQHMAEQQGFRPVAAIAAIAQHSMVAEVAAGRPDAADLTLLRDFGKTLAARLDAPAASSPTSFTAPGEFPFRKPPLRLPFTPETSDACISCGICATVCPAAAIPEDAPNTTLGDRCILCLACVQACPENARQVTHPKFAESRAWLKSSFAANRREPELF